VKIKGTHYYLTFLKKIYRKKRSAHRTTKHSRCAPYGRLAFGTFASATLRQTSAMLERYMKQHGKLNGRAPPSVAAKFQKQLFREMYALTQQIYSN